MSRPRFLPWLFVLVAVTLSCRSLRPEKEAPQNPAVKDIPEALLVELGGVGHIPHLEAPDRFHEVLLKFLKGGR